MTHSQNRGREERLVSDFGQHGHGERFGEALQDRAHLDSAGERQRGASVEMEAAARRTPPDTLRPSVPPSVRPKEPGRALQAGEKREQKGEREARRSMPVRWRGLA